MQVRLIIAIVDTLANDLATNITLHTHEATAIRWWSDACRDPNSWLAQHLDDHQLVQLGVLDGDLTIMSEKRIILTGAQWRAMQEAQLSKEASV